MAPGDGEILPPSIVAQRTAASPSIPSTGRAQLTWDSTSGADAYIVVRDGQEIAGPLRIEGSNKVWIDTVKP